MSGKAKAGLDVVERDAKDINLPLRPRPPFRRGSAAGPLRSLRQRRTINPLVLAGLVVVAVVSALAIPSLVGRTPVLTAAKLIVVEPILVEPIAAKPVEPRVAAAPEPAKPAASPVPAARAAAVVPDGRKPSPVPVGATVRPPAPVLSLDMLPVLIVDADEPEAAKPSSRKPVVMPRRPDPPPRPAVP